MSNNLEKLLAKALNHVSGAIQEDALNEAMEIVRGGDVRRLWGDSDRDDGRVDMRSYLCLDLTPPIKVTDEDVAEAVEMLNAARPRFTYRSAHGTVQRLARYLAEKRSKSDG